jgi:gas vesicle protein
MGEDPNAIRADIERTRAEMDETVDALGYKADVKTRAKEKLSRATPDGRQVRRAANTAQENPLGLAIGGIAVGFLVGLAVPSTRVEDEKIGPMADQVKDQIKETGQEAMERGKDVAQQAAETAKDAGQQHAQEMRQPAAN